MSDAPERIWATHNYVPGMINVLNGELGLEPSEIVRQTEYIRADLHAEAIEAAEQRGYARGIEAAYQKISEMWASTTQEHMDAIRALAEQEGE